jgi:hypothetical protein
MRVRRLRPQFPVAPVNDATRLYEFDADDLFAHGRRLRVDSSLGQAPRPRRPRRSIVRPR